MRAIHVVLVAAAGVTLALVGITFHAARARGEVERRLASAVERQARLRAELQRAQSVAAELAPTPASAPTPRPAAGEAPSVPVQALPPRVRPPGLRDFARDDPQLWNDFIASKRVELGRRHLPLMQRLNLSSAQRERMQDILAADVARASDLAAAAAAQGLEFNDPAIAALREESERRRKRELGELLGAAGLHELEAYERALSVRGFVDGLAVQLAANAPLSTSQADQLERALADSSEAYRAGKQAEPRGVDWALVDRRAREILSAEQFAVWQRGTAHNPAGGSRRAHELQAAYERAVKRMKEAAGVP